MKILVTPTNIAEVLRDLESDPYIGLDTETYGLAFDDAMFSLQLSTKNHAYYFNFHNYGEGTPHVWSIPYVKRQLQTMFADPQRTVFIHNAKFDLHRFGNHVDYFACTIHCTEAIERITYNQYKSYSLDNCLRRRGKRKNDRVLEYITRHKLYDFTVIEGKKRRIKNLHYDQVWFCIMFEYGCDDTIDVRFLGMDQLDRVYDLALYQTEYQLTKACYNMERVGICIDKEYVRHGKNYESTLLLRAKERATEEAGEEYINGPKWLRSVFDRFGQPYDLNPDTGNPIFDKQALDKMESEIAGLVREIRTREMYVGTYYSSFEYLNIDGVIHANIRQGGTDTGRFSYSGPNLQNVPKEEDFDKGDVQVRKCFVPREDHCFTMIDFDQQEFRLMLDYAGEIGLIRRIMNHGEDVHTATADLCGIGRTPAKRLNFGLLYGMGIEKLSKELGLTQGEGRDLRLLYFSRLPKVERLIHHIQKTAETRKYIKTWAGRKLNFPNPELCYKAPNHLIQGGCGDIARAAMIRLDAFLKYARSNMLVQVHDEIVFEMHKDELELVEDLRHIMEDVYQPMNGMYLTCGVEHSWTSWGKQDVIYGDPGVKK